LLYIYIYIYTGVLVSP